MPADTERALQYAQKLGELLRFETVSDENDLQIEKFTAFHGLLKTLFPNIFAAAEYENVEGCLLLKWKGSRPEQKPVLFMNHSDTVEVQGEWEHPPLSGEISEGKVWGRGALDTKGGLWGMLQAADELAAEGFVPECDIWFESSCCEEITRVGCGAEKVAELLAERGIRFSMILDEGGMIMYAPLNGVNARFAMVGMGERGCSSVKFTARGKGGHASTPEKNSPLVRLGKFMADADRNKVFKVDLADVIKEMFRRFSPFVEGPLKRVYADPDAFAPLLKAVIPSTSATGRALVQTTIAFTMAEGSNGMNVIPAEAYVVGNMRISHHQGFESSYKAISALAEKYGIESEIIERPVETRLSDMNTKAFRLVEDAVSAAFEDVHTAPYIMTGCSDARFMERLGDSCFRFVPFLISQEQMESIHGLNECVDVDTLPGAVDFYKYVMRGSGNV